MNTEQQTDILQEQFLKGAYQSPSQLRNDEDYNLIRVISEHDNWIEDLKIKLRGEKLYQDSTGERYFVQVEKPLFVKLDENNKPIRLLNPRTKRQEFICNDEAIETILSILRDSGLNFITPFTSFSENDIREDLRITCCRTAQLLVNKRKKWGMDKAEYPSINNRLRLLIQDARYKSKDGNILKAIKTTTSRIEQVNDAQRQKNMMERARSPFA